MGADTKADDLQWLRGPQQARRLAQADAEALIRDHGARPIARLASASATWFCPMVEPRRPDARALATRRAHRGPDGKASWLRHGNPDGEAPRSSGMMLIHRSAVASGLRVRLAHVGAGLWVLVILSSYEMIDARARVDPDDSVGGTMRVRLLVGGELAVAHWRWQ